MAWSYSGDPSTSPKDAVRFLLGDTDSTNELTLSDGEVNWLLTEWDNNVYFAAAAGAEQVAGQVAPEAAYQADGVSYSGDELQQKFEELAVRLRWLYKTKGRVAAPYVGGMSRSDIDANNSDPDLVTVDIGTGMHDFPGSGQAWKNPLENPVLPGDGYGVG